MTVKVSYIKINRMLSSEYKSSGSEFFKTFPKYFLSFSWISPHPFSKPEKLVTGGLFRFTRNPMYLGLTILLTGVWVLLGSVSPGIFVLAFLLIADRWYITYEEAQLLAVFGAKYVAYQAQTSRWI